MPSSALSILASIQKGVNRISESTANAKAKVKNTGMGLGELDNKYGGAISSTLSVIYEELRKAGSMWRDFNDTVIKDTRAIGLTIRDTAGYQRAVMEDSKRLTSTYGIAANEVMKFQSNLAQATGRAQLLNEEERRNMAAMNKLLGPETTNATIKAFDELGGSVETATAHAAQTYELAKRYGLDASQASATFAKNMKMANTYNFSSGIQGITKMTFLAQKLKFNMDSIARTADKFSTIEGAIENSAKLQMLGGNLGAMFSNPMDAMYEALNDMEGFTNRIVSGMSQRGKFNKASGVVELSPQDKMLIKEQAEALGMSREELTNMVTQSTKNKQIESELKGQFTEEQKAYVTSNAKYDAEAGKHYVERYNEATQQMEKLFTDELTADTVRELQNIAAPEQQMRGDVADIKRLLMDKFDKDAKWLVTQREREKGMREELSIAEAQTIDRPMNMYGDTLNWFQKSDIWKWITAGDWKTAVSMASIIPAYYIGKSGLIGAANGTTLRNLAGKAKGAPDEGAIGGSGSRSALGGTPPGYRSGSRVFDEKNHARASKKGYIKIDDKNGRERYYKLDENGKKTRVGREEYYDAATSKREKFADRVKGYKAKPKKTKIKPPKAKKPKIKAPKMKGRGIAGLLMSTAMMIGTSYAAGKLAEGASGEEQGGVESEDSGIITELQKQTALLEKLAGVKASDLVGTSESGGTGEEESGFGVSDALGYAVYTSPAQKLIGKGATEGMRLAARTPGVGSLIEKGTERLATTNTAWSTKLAEKGAEKIAKGGVNKLAGKALTKIATKGIGGGPLAWGGLALDFANAGMQAAGLYEAGSTADKGMNIGSAALTGVGIGASLGTIIPGVGNLVGAAVGGLAGTVYGVVDQYGEEIKNWAGDKVDKAKEFIFGSDEDKAKTDADRAQDVFETTKIGATSIEDPAIMQKAALATIGIHDLLISKWNIDNGKYSNGEEKKKGLFGTISSVASAPFKAFGGIIGGVSSLFGSSRDDARMPSYNVGGAYRMPEVRSSGMLGSLIKSTVLATPLGMLSTLISNPELAGGRNDALATQTPEINLNVSGTIKLDAGSSSAEIDVRKLLNDKQFMDRLTTIISENFQRNATMGVGRDMNNPARNTIGNTDVTSNRRR